MSVNSPTLDSSDDVKDRFYDTLYFTLRRISLDDKIILLGDFNAWVGRNHNIWHGVIGHHGVGNMNSSGLQLLSLCSEMGLAITNTFIQLRGMHKTYWMHPRSKHWHLIDYVIDRLRDLNEVKITLTMRGAVCSTDHLLICSTIRQNVLPPARSVWKLPLRGQITCRHCRQPKTSKLPLLVKYHTLAIDEVS